MCLGIPGQVVELVDFVVFRILDHLGVRDAGAKRWAVDPEGESTKDTKGHEEFGRG